MIGLLFAPFTEFLQDDLFFVLDFVFGSNIVLGLADCTNQSDFDSVIFFGHGGIIY